jgi:hypothetical protein
MHHFDQSDLKFLMRQFSSQRNYKNNFAHLNPAASGFTTFENFRQRCLKTRVHPGKK